jgi:Tol biopolymer transport system component
MEDRNGLLSDVYVFDVDSSTITRVSVDPGGRQPAVGSSFAPSVSGDGRYVAFVSSAPLDGEFDRQLLPRPAERCRHVYLRNLDSGVTRRVSAARGGRTPTARAFIHL